MTVMRAFLGGLLLCALAACDSDKPPQPQAPSSESAETTVLPAPVPAEPKPPVPAAEAEPAPESATEPVSEAQPAPPQEAPQARSAPRSADSPRAAAPSRPLAPLDLSLPSEVLERFQLPDEMPLESLEPSPLLPPLFVDKTNEPDSFELGGKLITSERPVADEDSWHSVDGVELQLQFRR